MCVMLERKCGARRHRVCTWESLKTVSRTLPAGCLLRASDCQVDEVQKGDSGGTMLEQLLIQDMRAV